MYMTLQICTTKRTYVNNEANVETRKINTKKGEIISSIKSDYESSKIHQILK